MSESHLPALGTVFPHHVIGTDPRELRSYASALEELELAQLVAYDHVLGVGLDGRPGWKGAYSWRDRFHEPFTLFSFLAGITTTLEFATCVLVLPQRQTALVAKQSAELHLVSGGRFRLGVGTGWNETEYEALGVPFQRRGARLDEQIEVLRALWTKPTVDVDGEFHRIDDAGINPLPEGPIPIWVGGAASNAVRERIARLADGWMVPKLSREEATQTIGELRRLATTHGRDPASLDMEARLYLGQVPRDQWRHEAEEWRAVGASRLNLITDGLGIETVEQELEALADAVAAIR